MRRGSRPHAPTPRCCALRPRPARTPHSLRCRRTSTSSTPPPKPEPPPSLPRRLWAGYVRQLERRPLPVKLISAVVIFSTGDIATQRLVEGVPMASIDLQRTARMACFGTTATCYIHTWWGFLEPRAAAVFCPTAQRLQNTAFKVFCDQTFGAGSFNLIFFFQTALMEGRSVIEALRRVREQWWPQMRRHWCLWPAFHMCNFYFNPLHLRVFFQNLALVGWSSVLSSVGAAATAADVAVAV